MPRGNESSGRSVQDLTPPPGVIAVSRTCDSCGGAMPSRQARQRDDEGRLVCDSCKANPQPGWTTTHSALSVVDQMEMQRREAEAITSIVRVRKAKHAGLSTVAHDSGDTAIVNHCFSCGSGAVVGSPDGTVSCEFCHTNFTVQVQPSHPFMPQTIDGQPTTPPGMPGGTPEPSELSAPVDLALEEQPEGDPAAAEPPRPPEEGEAPEGEGNQDDKKNLPPWLKNKSSKQATEEHGTTFPSWFVSGQWPKCRCGYDPHDNVALSEHYREHGFEEYDDHGQIVRRPITGSYRTTDGRTLEEPDYMARLALEMADDREIVLDAVRVENMKREAATVDCWSCGGGGDQHNGEVCKVCNGTGLVDPRADMAWKGSIPSPKTSVHHVDCPTCEGSGWRTVRGDWRNPEREHDACPTCGGQGQIDADNPEHFEFREPPHEGSMRPFDSTSRDRG